MLTRDTYKELEEAVGQEHVSQEPAVLDGYAWQPTYNDSPVKWVIRPEAVVLPKTTEEVQAIVKACNRHGLKFKAFSTGWGVWNGPTTEGVILLDLCRMNSILEIDDKNMLAVVEPYVCGAQLQAEAMKVGLNTHIIGAGPNCSPLAAATSMAGVGWDGIYMSHSARNVLGVEWVLPNGELLRLGTLGSGAGWFCGDGPGPSLRGIMRGYVGAQSGLGVFTKCAIKLFHWPGPQQMKLDGLLFDARADLPKNVKFYLCFFPNMSSLSHAVYRIGNAEIGYNAFRIALGAYLFLGMPRLYRKLLKTKALRALFEEVFKYCWEIMLVADSEQEMEFQERVLREIVSEAKGLPLDMMLAPPLGSMLLMNVLRSTIPPLAFRIGGLFGSALPRNDAWDSQANWAEVSEGIKKEWVEKGGIMDDMIDNPFMVNYEHNAWAHCEEVFLYDAKNQKHLESLESVYMDFTIAAIEQCMESMMGFNPRIRKLISPLAGNYNRWQKAISQTLDPNAAADAGLYTGEEDFDFSRMDPDKRKRLEGLLDKHKWPESTPPR